MIKINLLPQRIIQQRERKDFVIFVGICGVVALGICYLFYLSLGQTISPVENKVKELEKKIAQYQPVLKEIESIKQENNRLISRFEVFRSVIVKQSFWPKLLFSLYTCLPQSVWLEEIKGEKGQDFIEIRGKSLEKTIGVAEFIKNLEKLKIFSSIEFDKFSQQEMYGREVMSFQLKCFLPLEVKGK